MHFELLIPIMKTNDRNLRINMVISMMNFENLKSDLDAFVSELHMLTDHSIALDANFSKYGYSAHLGAYDDGSGPSSSADSLYHGPDNHEKKDWAAEKRNGRIMKLYKVKSYSYLKSHFIRNM